MMLKPGQRWHLKSGAYDYIVEILIVGDLKIKVKIMQNSGVLWKKVGAEYDSDGLCNLASRNQYWTYLEGQDAE